MSFFNVVTFLMGILILETVFTIGVWAARSPWFKYQAGRSLMALLLGQVGIVSLAIVSRLFGYEFPYREVVYTVFYLILVIAMAWVGITIVRAQNDDRKKVG